MASAIRHIAPAPGTADLFATAAFERDVAVWSLRQRQRIGSLKTVLDFGGRRLCVVPDEPTPLIVAAAYHVHGVCAYDVTGRLVWERRDLKRPQNITAVRDERGAWLLAVGRAGSALAVIDARTGETEATLRGVRGMFAGGRVSLHVRTRTANLVSSEPARNWDLELNSFAVLDAAFSHDEVLFSEAGGSSRCVTLTGRPRWSWDPGAGRHAVRLAWGAASDTWLAVVWQYERGGPHQLVRLDRDGRMEHVADLGSVSEQAFLGQGEYLVTSDGNVREAVSGRLAWQFAS